MRDPHVQMLSTPLRSIVPPMPLSNYCPHSVLHSGINHGDVTPCWAPAVQPFILARQPRLSHDNHPTPANRRPRRTRSFPNSP